MRRASASDRFIVRTSAAAALAVGLATCASSVSAEADDSDDAGKLSLNTTVLVNESAGTGSSGEFAIRSRLFSDRLAGRVEQQRERSAERLSVVDALTFVGTRTSGEQYESVKALLFENYTSDVIASSSDDRTETPVLQWVAAVVAVPLVLVAGIVLGRRWARRGRATS